MRDNTSQPMQLMLPLFPCHFLEFPENRVDCSDEACVRCNILGRFFAGGIVTEDGSIGPGRAISIVVWLLNLLFGIFGAVTNCLIISVIMKRKRRKSFDLFLIALASMDLLGSVTSMIASSSTISFIENWNRGLTANIFVYFGTLTCFLARSGSSFMTVMITLERYLIIAFPTRSRTWFTPRNSKFMIAGIYFFTSVILALPRYTAFQIVPNDFGKNISSLKSWSHIMVSTPLSQFWYKTLGGYFSKIDFWVPLPTLLLLNLLVFIEILKFARKRKEMNVRQEKEIRAVKMFVPVVLALFLCNIEPYIYYYFVVNDRIAYRDMFLGVFLSVAVNSSVNMPIYYFRGTNFRREVQELLANNRFFAAFRKCTGNGAEGNDERSTGVLDVSSKQSEDNAFTNKYAENAFV